MSIFIDDVYNLIINNLDLKCLLIWRSTDKFHLKHIQTKVLSEYLTAKKDIRSIISLDILSINKFENLANYLFDNNIFNPDKLANIFANACIDNNVIFAKKIYDTGLIDKYKLDGIIYTSSCIAACAVKNNTDIIKYIYSIGFIDLNIYMSALKMCCQKNYFELASTILSFDKIIDIDIINNSYTDYFDVACYYGSLETAKVLYEYGIGHNDNSKKYAIKLACLYGKYNVYKWFLTIYDDCDLDYDELFIKCCRSGNLYMAQEIFTKVNNPSHKCISTALYDACIHNYLDIAQWLYSLQIVKFEDFGTWFSLLMIYCVGSNCTDVIKWIYSVYKFDLFYNNDAYYKMMIESNYTELAEWYYNTALESGDEQFDKFINRKKK